MPTTGCELDYSALTITTSTPGAALFGQLIGKTFNGIVIKQHAIGATAGLDPVWASYAPPVGPLLASHMIEMQVGLDEARAKLNLPRVVYTWPSPAVGQFIHRRDIEDVRTGVK